MKLHRLAATALLAALTGCANNYARFYEPWPMSAAATISDSPAGPLDIRKLTPTAAEQAIPALLRSGYVILGTSTFTAGQYSGQLGRHAVSQAQKVGADTLVLLDPQYASSTTMLMPTTTPTTSTSYTTGSATVSGSGGRSATASGSAVTTTYGSQTAYAPSAIRRLQYGAYYLAKRRTLLGAHFVDLSPEARQQAQQNRGAQLTLIVDDSPAFREDLLPGDILTAIDGEPIVNGTGLAAQLQQRRETAVTLTVHRPTGQITKRVQLDS